MIPETYNRQDWPRLVKNALVRLEKMIAAGGGSAWGSITGSISAQTDLAGALAGKADTAHTHVSGDVSDFAAASRAQTEAELVAGTNVTITPSGSGATRQLTIAATSGGGLSGTATITVPANNGAGAYEWSETVTATGVTPSSVPLCQLAAGVDADENTADFIDLITLSATPATNALTINMVVSTPVSGAIAVNWKV